MILCCLHSFLLDPLLPSSPGGDSVPLGDTIQWLRPTRDPEVTLAIGLLSKSKSSVIWAGQLRPLIYCVGGDRLPASESY